MTSQLTPVQKDRVRLWVRDLESGEFQQGMHSLRSHERDATFHCCLGVATERCVREGVVGEGIWDTQHAEVMPTSVQAWYGLESNDPVVQSSSAYNYRLSKLNDNGLSFAEIARAIRIKYLDGEGVDDVAQGN